MKVDRLLIGRAVFLVCLVVIALVLAYGSSYFLQESEIKLAEHEFESVADHILVTAQLATSQRHLGIRALATMVAGEEPDAAKWPFVAFDNFESVAGDIITTFDGRPIQYAPIVQPEQVVEFNDFAYDYFESNYQPGTGYSSAGRGVWGVDRFGPGKQYTPYLDFNGTTLWGSDYTYLTPTFHGQGSGRTGPTYMKNLHSEDNLGPAIDRVYECGLEKKRLNDVSMDCSLLEYAELRDSSAILISPVFPDDNATEVPYRSFFLSFFLSWKLF
mmetsp:Transcript_28858/g.48456  ORF Transcript_28858/g.48456 Transcript_28858/m.48456 type:complete len:272 (-) Transcript_28858:123-938(-)